MTKIGRNDPCPCGSGKKYKKCCANDDQQKAIAETNNSAVDNFLLNSLNSTDNDADLHWNDEIDEQPDEDPYPAISGDEEKLVNEWWDVYEKIESLEEIRNHLDDFMDKYPHLVENLGLEHEVLFELGGEYRRHDRGEEYILFLMDFRNRFPATFARSAGYYDSDIIAWLISNGRSNEIKNYLNYFKEKPVKFIDQLYQLIYLLQATDTTDEIINLISRVAEPVMESDEVIFADDLVQPLIINILSGYIRHDFAKDDAARFINDLNKVLPYQTQESEHSIDFWTKQIQAITKPFGPWGDNVPQKPEKLNQLYSKMTLNFMRYLYEKRDISWMSAQYYADLANDFLAVHPEDKIKKSKRLYDFSKMAIEKRLASLTREMVIYVNCTKFMGLLNAIYLFAAYLSECNMFTTEETGAVQQNCKSIYYEYYPRLKKEYYEALCFSEIPIL